MSIRGYPDYKGSNLPYIDSVPSHWILKKIAWDIPYSVGWTPPSGNEDYYDGDIPWVTIGDLERQSIKSTKSTITELAVDVRKAKPVPPGSLLFSFKLSVGKVTFTAIECFTNEAIAAFEPNKTVILSYWYYASPLIIPHYGRDNIYGAKLLNQDLIGSVKFYCPPKTEQQKIAQFLDYETAKIDALIDEQKRLIELLKEKRQAVISHAVTKGLNPNAPMKDSGVEWLGEVPEYWNIVKLKYLIHGLIDTEHKTVPFDDEGEFFVARTSDIRGGKLDLNGAKRTNQSGYIEWTKRGAPKKGDIIFTREAPAGEACIVPVDDRICLGQRTVLIKLNESSLASGFALWSLYGGLASRFITELSQGSTVSHINMADIPNIPVLLPSLDEQKNIDAYLKSVADKYDSLKAHSEQLMTRLHERRSALISAAVTGKIDVRDWQPPAGSDTVDSNALVQTERHYG